ncbi:MAG: thioredoxin domain-containing protein, partial [Acidobacteriota bacterium]|nr:thioredoxin domain-containing protein [Acidobacteriota bacterium]
QEKSPYLQQHAHNPVDWYPWGPEALARARDLDRPIFLSIGYSTCHWCHVMEEESFEDLEIAEFLNRNYVAIKVDREERPDLDAIYMTAVQALTGRGGWPMTTWLTPAGEPFYGGTYFPARDGDRGAPTGFLTLLQRLHTVYQERPDEIAGQAKTLVARIRNSMQVPKGEALPAADLPRQTALRYKNLFDETWGGLKRAPKFPSSFPLRLLMRIGRSPDDRRLTEMAMVTLDAMAQGGIHDQVGGGFHRYSVDGQWLVPHFEKMLYDNALLAVAYLEAYQIDGEPRRAEVVRRTLDYVLREMSTPAGSFYSATDADSVGPDGHSEEGYFFTWTPAELAAVLGEERASWVGRFYGITTAGNFEGRSIPTRRLDLAELAKELKRPFDELRDALDQARNKLYRARSNRAAPLRDEKILVAWNGLMISAMARGGFVLNEPRYVDAARRAATDLLAHNQREGRLLRSRLGEVASTAGYLEDYAFLIAGLLDLYQVTGEARWFEEAVRLQSVQEAHFADPAGGYFRIADDHETLLVREKPARDGAEPGGNSVALMNLLRLHAWTSEDRYRQQADRLLVGFSSILAGGGNGLTEMLLALGYRHADAREIVLSFPPDGGDPEPFLQVLRGSYLPDAVFVMHRSRSGKNAKSVTPIAEGKVARDGKVTAYICRQGSCERPTNDPARFAEQLKRVPDAVSKTP